MAAQVIIPKKEDPLTKISQVGQIAALATGNPGAAQGIGIGTSLLQGATNKNVSAVERRMGQSAKPPAQTADDPQDILQKSMLALRDQPPEVQKQYAPQIQAAMLKLNRGQV